MSFDQMVEGGIYSYIHAPAETDHMAGVYDQEDWFFVDDRTRRFWQIANEEYGMDAYIDQFAVLMGKQGSSTEYYLHPTSYDVWRRRARTATCRSPGRNAVLVPAHILLRPRLSAAGQRQRARGREGSQLDGREDGEVHDRRAASSRRTR